jgi:hypothetical protein
MSESELIEKLERESREIAAIRGLRADLADLHLARRSSELKQLASRIEREGIGQAEVARG